MAAPKEKLPSLGDLTHMERKTFAKQRDHCLTNSKVRQLQQRWQELKERELRAQQHNKELLQQFEKAQDTLKEMLDCTAAMKTIRMEYERYLKESSPRWQQQLKERTQAAQRMGMEDNLRLCLKNTKEAEVTKAYADQRSQGCIKQTQHTAGTQNKDGHNIHSDYDQDSSPYHPYVQASWLTHPQFQTAGIPMRASHQPQSSSHVPPSFLSHPHPFVLHHLSSTPSHHPWPRQNAPGGSYLQTDCPWSWTAAAAGLPEALWGQLYNKEPPTELMNSPTVAQGSEIIRGASSSSSERCGGRRSSRLSQELDIKPVRLSSGHAESNESGRDSTPVIRERRKKEKRGKSQCTSSKKPSHSSEESSRTSSAVIINSAAVVQSSERDVSSGKCKKRRQRSGVQVAESLSIEKVLKEKNRNEGDESASERSSEESGRETEESTGENASADDKSGECGKEESGSICIKAGDEKQKQIISSEQSSSDEKDEDEHAEDLGGENKAEDKENSLEGDDQDEDVEDEPDEKEKCLKEKEQDKKDEEEADEEEKATEDEMEEQECEVKDELKKDDGDKRSSASSQDESELDKTEEDEKGSEEGEQGESEEEQRSDKEGEPEEESDSEESVISPQGKRRHIIPEEAAEDEEEKAKKAGFSEGDDSNDFSEEDDIENLLTPQEQRQKRGDKDLKPAEKLKVPDMKIVQAEDDRSTKITPQHSDSDEFDHFYD